MRGRSLLLLYCFYFSLKLCQCLLCIFRCFNVGCICIYVYICICNYMCYIFRLNYFIIMSLATVFDLKSLLLGFPLFCLLFAWNLFLHLFTFSLCVSWNLKYIVGSCFLIHWGTQCFWLESLVHLHLKSLLKGQDLLLPIMLIVFCHSVVLLFFSSVAVFVKWLFSPYLVSVLYFNCGYLGTCIKHLIVIAVYNWS